MNDLFAPRARRAVVALTVVGAVVIAPGAAYAAGPEHTPTVKCSAYVRSDGVIVFAGSAVAAVGHVPATQTTVFCSYTGANGRYTSANTSPGPVVWAYTRGDLEGPIVVCESATASYVDGHIGHVPERCDHVTPDPLPDEQMTDVTMDCQSPRQPTAWVLTAYGVAPQRAAPPVSTTVSCTLTFEDGRDPIRREKTTPGGASFLTEPVLDAGGRTATRCFDVFVLYADSATSWSEGCNYPVPE